MSFAFDLYVDRPSWLHRLDPRTKLSFVLVSSFVLLSFGSPFVSAAFLLGIHGVLWSGKVPASRLRWAWQRMWPITLLILVLWPVFYPQGNDVLWQVWRIRITTQGLWQGLGTALRINALAFAFLVLLFSTDQARLVRGLVKLGLPYEWGLTLAIALRYLPTLYGIYTAVSEAQQARGWVVAEGSFVQRIKSYLPVLVAVIVGALRLADNLSLALAARGFQSGAKRTHLRELELSPADKVSLILLAVLLIILLIVRLRAW